MELEIFEPSLAQFNFNSLNQVQGAMEMNEQEIYPSSQSVLSPGDINAYRVGKC